MKSMGHPSDIFFMTYFYRAGQFPGSATRICILLPAATKLRQGNIFTRVCRSVHREGVCLIACWDIPSSPPRAKSRHPRHQRQTLPPGPKADTPSGPKADTPLPPDQKQTNPPTPPGPKADPPTGMHSCLKLFLSEYIRTLLNNYVNTPITEFRLVSPHTCD